MTTDPDLSAARALLAELNAAAKACAPGFTAQSLMERIAANALGKVRADALASIDDSAPAIYMVQARMCLGIIDCTGPKPVVRRVQGTFKLTEDGAVACEEGDCWCLWRICPSDDWKVGECRRSGNPTDYGCWWQVDDCDSESVEIKAVYSTRELAAAAQSAGGGRGEDGK